VEMTSDDVIKNSVYRQRRTFNKSFLKSKTWHCKSTAEGRCEYKLELSLIKSLSKKIDKISFFRTHYVSAIHSFISSVISFYWVGAAFYCDCELETWLMTPESGNVRWNPDGNSGTADSRPSDWWASTETAAPCSIDANTHVTSLVM